MSNAPIVKTDEDFEDDNVPTPGAWLDSLIEEDATTVVQLVAELDPLDRKFSTEQRDQILAARKVWQATGL